MKLKATYQLLAYADDMNLLGDNINTTKKNKETFNWASMEIGLEINAEKTKYMLLSRHWNVGQNQDILVMLTTIRSRTFCLFVCCKKE
jgi:hypothetical protein